MTKILIGDPVGTLELMHLEQAFNEECKCEADHAYMGNVCEITVVGRVVSCRYDVKECQRGIDYNVMHSKLNVCRG